METTIINFRDLGGLKANKNTIKCNKIFRASAPICKKKSERDFLSSLNLDYIFDFRHPKESAEKAVFVPTGTSLLNIPVFKIKKYECLMLSNKVMFKMIRSDEQTIREFIDTIKSAYSYMPYATHSYSIIFDAMKEGKSFLFHCSAGKDRTGVCALMIESILGRTISECKTQYLLSHQYIKFAIDKSRKQLKLLRVKQNLADIMLTALDVHEEWFDMAVEEMTKNHSCIIDFVKDTYSLTDEDIKTIRANYLE